MVMFAPPSARRQLAAITRETKSGPRRPTPTRFNMILFPVAVACLLLFVSTTIAGGSNFTLVVAGDISFDGPIRYFGDRSCGYLKPFDNVKDIIQEADLALANFESPIVFPNMTSSPLVPAKEIHLGAWASSAKGLRYAGFDVVGVANNHLLDYGDPSVRLTTKTLSDLGISYVGVNYGKNNPDRQAPFIRVINGIRIGILAYCSNAEGCSRIRSLGYAGPVLYKLDVVEQDTIDLKAKDVDIIVVFFHWGIEYRLIPSPGIRKICRAVKKLGVDVVLGSHQHVVQGHTLDSDGLVIYSLGNFLFHRNDIFKWMFYHNHVVDLKKLEIYKSTLNMVTTATQRSRIFKIILSKTGVVSAAYRNLIIVANNTDYCIQPTPVSPWTPVCVGEDINCLNDFEEVMASQSEE